MQTVSALYNTIVASDNHWFETKVVINGNTIGETGIKSLTRKRLGMNENKPSIGGAVSSELNLVLFDTSVTIPRMAAVSVYFRARNATQTSEWLQGGVYYVDTRSKDETAGSLGTISITAYDAMMMFEQDYPDTAHSWPYTDKLVIAEMATAAGVTVDSRTYDFITATFQIDLPVSYTMREVLERIAAMYGGNFVITAEGKLLFVPLYGLSDENITANYLAQDGNTSVALQFGTEGWFIIV